MSMHFSKYALVGVANNALHWCVFLLCYRYVSDNQAVCNVAAFFIAASFSFYVNCRWTFQARPTVGKYGTFVAIMGGIAAGCGVMANVFGFHPMMTLVVFSGVSVGVGFLASKLLVFRPAKYS